MPTNCEIYFDGNLDRVFYGGQIVSGRVELSLTKEKIVRGDFDYIYNVWFVFLSFFLISIILFVFLFFVISFITTSNQQ